MVGHTLSHYRIVERLGVGGMGEVYRAHDLKLDRDVALKVLPAETLADDEARRRFRKEAHALSRLSHPHVAHLLDFDSENGTDFLVMELVAGPSLEEALRPGPLPEKEVVRLGSQLARGLQTAHEQGVVHRDLKPSNIALTPDGLLKILDFGLARLVTAPSAPSGRTTATETAAGAVAGSPPYMAPEQLLGKVPDARTDLYSAGAVLYELATGKRPFGGRSGVALTDAILHEPPASPRSLNSSVSPGLEAVIAKALDKDPDLRYQSAKDLLVDLERLQARGDDRSGREPSPGARPAARRPRRRWPYAVAAAGVMTVAVLWLLRPPPAPRVIDIRPLHLGSGPDFVCPGSTWATDGVRIYYAARKQNGSYGLYQVAVGGGEPEEIPTPFGLFRVHGYLPRQAALVVLSQLQSDTAATPDEPVWLVPVPKGTPRRLGGLRANWAAVSPDGERLAILDVGRLLLARADGGDARDIMALQKDAGWIRWSPDGKLLRFASSGPPGREREAWVWETSPEGGNPRPLWAGGRGAWTTDGHYFLFESPNRSARRTDIFAVREAQRLPWSRPHPVQLTFGPVSLTHVGSRPDGHGLVGFGIEARGEARRFDRRTRRFEPILAGESVDFVKPSPDGRWLAWVTYPEGTLWRGRPDGGERLQLTSPPERAWMPSWSPDGASIAFVGELPGGQGRSVRLVHSDGGAVLTLKEATGGASYWDPCWLADGQSVVFSDEFGERPGIHRVDVETRNVTLLEGAAGLMYPKCGPAGQILAQRPGLSPTLTVYSPVRGAWADLGPQTIGFPSWTRDGRSICGLGADFLQIRCQSIASGRVEDLMDTGSAPMLVGTAGWPWMGLDADDNPIVILDRSTRDFYAIDWDAP